MLLCIAYYQYIANRQNTMMGQFISKNAWTLDMSFPTSVDFDWQKFKSNTVVVFLPEEKVETVLFWHDNKRQLHNVFSSAASATWNLWSVPVHPYFELSEPFETTGTVCNTHKISDDRPVIGSQHPMAIYPRKSAIPGPISPFIAAFLWTTKWGYPISIWCGVWLDLVFVTIQLHGH